MEEFLRFVGPFGPESLKGIQGQASEEEGRLSGWAAGLPSAEPGPAGPGGTPLSNRGVGMTFGNGTYDQIVRVKIDGCKLGHSLDSWRKWEAVRRDLGLDFGAEACGGMTSHRAFGAKYPWGGFELWGLFTSDAEESRPYFGLRWMPGADLGMITELREQGLPMGDPGEHQAITEWKGEGLDKLGERLGENGLDRVWLMQVLLKAGARPMRLDAAADFPGQSIEPFWEIAERWAESKGRIRDFLPFETCERWDSRGKPGGGRSVAFGTRKGSPKYLRVYEKGAQMRLGVDLLRVEAELKGIGAVAFGANLVACGSEWQHAISGVIAGIIDFRKGYSLAAGSGLKAVRETKRYAFWAKMLRQLMAAPVKLQGPPKAPPSLAATKAWMELALPQSLARMKLWADGPEEFTAWLGGLIADGEKRLTPSEKRQISDEPKLFTW